MAETETKDASNERLTLAEKDDELPETESEEPSDEFDEDIPADELADEYEEEVEPKEHKEISEEQLRRNFQAEADKERQKRMQAEAELKFYKESTKPAQPSKPEPRSPQDFMPEVEKYDVDDGVIPGTESYEARLKYEEYRISKRVQIEQDERERQRESKRQVDEFERQKREVLKDGKLNTTSIELDEVIQWMQQPDFSLKDAIRLYRISTNKASVSKEIPKTIRKKGSLNLESSATPPAPKTKGKKYLESMYLPEDIEQL